MQALATGFFAASEKPLLARILLGCIASSKQLAGYLHNAVLDRAREALLAAEPTRHPKRLIALTPLPRQNCKFTRAAARVPAREQPHMLLCWQSRTGGEGEGTHFQGRVETEQRRTAVSSNIFTQLRTSR